MSPKEKKKETVDLNVEIPASLKARLDSYCEARGLKIKKVVEIALTKFLDEAEAK